MGQDGDIGPLDQAAVTLHELYSSFRRAGFTRAEATSIIAKVAAEIIAQQMADESRADET